MGSVRHEHDMRGTDEPGVLKCASCLFRCTEKALKKVKASTDLHQVITKRDPRAGEVWQG